MNAAQIRTALAQDAETLAELRTVAAAFGPRFAKDYAPRIAKLEASFALWTGLLAKQVAAETAAVSL